MPEREACGGPVERARTRAGRGGGPRTRQRLIVDGAHMSSEEDEKPAARHVTFSLEDGTVLWDGTAETFGPRPFVQLADEAGKKYIFKRINREAFISKG